MTATSGTPARTLPRFTRGERWVHRTTAVATAVLVATGAVLYYEPFAVAVGRRPLVEGLHIAAGLLLPLPTLAGLLLSRPFRADLRRLNRLSRVDWQWLRRRDRRTAGLPVGKFNGGQKLAASVIAGAGLVLFGTGLLLIAPVRLDLPDGVRQGATITHDLFTFGLMALLAGHLWQAYRHPEARAALRTGAVDRRYAEVEHPAWTRDLVD